MANELCYIPFLDHHLCRVSSGLSINLQDDSAAAKGCSHTLDADVCSICGNSRVNVELEDQSAATGAGLPPTPRPRVSRVEREPVRVADGSCWSSLEGDAIYPTRRGGVRVCASSRGVSGEKIYAEWPKNKFEVFEVWEEKWRLPSGQLHSFSKVQH